MPPKPALFAAMGDAFIEAFGDGQLARIEGGIEFPEFATREVSVIIRAVREGGLAEDIFTAIEGVTHTCSAKSADCSGIEQGMRLTLLSTNEIFEIAGKPDDGRAMTQLLLELQP